MTRRIVASRRIAKNKPNEGTAMHHVHPRRMRLFAAICFTAGCAMTLPALCQEMPGTRSVLRTGSATGHAAQKGSPASRLNSAAEPAEAFDESLLRFDHEPRPEGPLGQPKEAPAARQSAVARRTEPPVVPTTPAAPRRPAQNTAATPALARGRAAAPTSNMYLEQVPARSHSQQVPGGTGQAGLRAQPSAVRSRSAAPQTARQGARPGQYSSSPSEWWRIQPTHRR
jgi:hypothetical protein